MPKTKGRPAKKNGLKSAPKSKVRPPKKRKPAQTSARTRIATAVAMTRAAVVEPRTYALFKSVIEATLVAKSSRSVARFATEEVRVPALVGSRYPGPLNVELMPEWVDLLEIVYSPRVRSFDLCKSARIGGTLFFAILPVLHKIVEWPGPILWMDPTSKTARRQSRQEIQPYIRDCVATDALRIPTKTAWTALQMLFTTCQFNVVGAGSVADLGGLQAELIIINEQDKIPSKDRAEAPPKERAKVRASLFEDTCKILGNSTPTLESGLSWGDFLAGSQRYLYVQCPHCRKLQRLTPFKEEGQPDKWMRCEHEPQGVDREHFTEIKKAPDGRGWLVKGIPPTGRLWWPPNCRDSVTKQWDVDAVAASTRYECGFCEQQIHQSQLGEMKRVRDWRSHNPTAPEDHESAQHWAIYNPQQKWGGIARRFLLATGSAGKLHSVWNETFGLPYIPIATRVTKKTLAMLQAGSPKYDRYNPQEHDSALMLPVRPVVITLHVDVQQTEFWWSQRAVCEDGSRYLLAWGPCVSFPELVDISNRVWTFDHGPDVPSAARYEEFTTFLGIMDSGYKAKRVGGVYRFLHEQGGRWQGFKGGGFQGREKPIHETHIAFNYDGKQVDIPLIHGNDFILTEHFARFVLKERRPPGYYLPQRLDDPLEDQLTAPHLVKRRLPDGRTEHLWEYSVDPHLFDCEKMGEVLLMALGDALKAIRVKQDKARERLLTDKAS